MRLTPLLTGLLAFVVIGCFSVASAAEPVSAEKLYQAAREYTDALNDQKLGGKPRLDWIETEKDLLGEISARALPADQAFCARIGLAAATNRLLPLLDAPAPIASRESSFKLSQGGMAAGRLLIARGHQLCQQGKAAEGRDWFLRTHQLARKCGADQTLVQLLTAAALDNLAQSAAASYVEVWPKAERLDYIDKLNALKPLPDLETTTTNDWKLFAPAGTNLLRSLAPGTQERAKQMKATILKTERRATALKLALRYGAELEADQVGLLTDADGQSLKLGESFTLKRAAILGQPLFRRDAKEPPSDESEYQPSDFLVIGPIK